MLYFDAHHLLTALGAPRDGISLGIADGGDVGRSEDAPLVAAAGMRRESQLASLGKLTSPRTHMLLTYAFWQRAPGLASPQRLRQSLKPLWPGACERRVRTASGYSLSRAAHTATHSLGREVVGGGVVDGKDSGRRGDEGNKGGEETHRCREGEKWWGGGLGGMDSIAR